MPEKRLRIGELAATLGLNPKTIRYYEDIGLLPTPERTSAGYRLYGPADHDRLEFIVKARAIGFTLDEIGEILALRQGGQKPCEHVVALLDRKVAAIDEQLRALTDVRQEFVRLRQEAAESVRLDARVCGIIEHHPLGHHVVPAPSELTPVGRRPRHSEAAGRPPGS